jgi:hypothetical protein
MFGLRRVLGGRRPSKDPARLEPCIALWGTFDLPDHGELLLPRIFEHELRKRLPFVQVVDYSPLGFKHPTPRERPARAEPRPRRCSAEAGSRRPPRPRRRDRGRDPHTRRALPKPQRRSGRATRPASERVLRGRTRPPSWTLRARPVCRRHAVRAGRRRPRTPAFRACPVRATCLPETNHQDSGLRTSAQTERSPSFLMPPSWPHGSSRRTSYEGGWTTSCLRCYPREGRPVVVDVGGQTRRRDRGTISGGGKIPAQAASRIAELENGVFMAQAAEAEA